MGFLVSFVDYQPAPRYDAIPWDRAVISEATAKEGPYTDIDLFVFDPLDADPREPALRSFSTTNATAESRLWYKVTFMDAADNQQPTSPVYNSPNELVPSAAEVRSELPNIGFAELGYPEPAPGGYDRLEGVITEAVSEMEGYLGEIMTDDTLTGARAVLIRRAVKWLTAYNVGSSTQEILDTAVDYDMIQSMSAEGYSETRRAIGPNLTVLHPWPALNRMLNFILYFDQGGQRGNEAPGLLNQGATPRPGSHIMESLYPTWPYTKFGTLRDPTVPIVPFSEE